MYRTIVAGILSLTSSFWMAIQNDGGEISNKVATTTTVTTVVETPKEKPAKRTPSILDELVGHTIPDIGYLFQRAQCETGFNWRNGGSYSGAFGMYRGTFQQWGGYEDFGFYNASEAPREVQVLVWYRVHYLGYQSVEHGWIPSAGRLINNCSEYAEKHYDGEVPLVKVTRQTVDLWRILIANMGRG